VLRLGCSLAQPDCTSPSGDNSAIRFPVRTRFRAAPQLIFFGRHLSLLAASSSSTSQSASALLDTSLLHSPTSTRSFVYSQPQSLSPLPNTSSRRIWSFEGCEILLAWDPSFKFSFRTLSTLFGIFRSIYGGSRWSVRARELDFGAGCPCLHLRHLGTPTTTLDRLEPCLRVGCPAGNDSGKSLVGGRDPWG